MTQPSRPTYAASERTRKAVLRATPTFWLMLLFGGTLLCLTLYGASRSVFRASANPFAAGTPIAALLPTSVPPTATLTPSPRPPSTSIPQYIWTVNMKALTNGQYMVPGSVAADIQAAWRQALDSLDALPWETISLDAFTGDALTAAKQQKVPTGALTKTVPGKRVFTIVGCDVSGGVCQVTEAFAQISLDQYDAATQKKVGSATLKNTVLYVFVGTMVYDGRRWKLSTLQPPVEADS